MKYNPNIHHRRSIRLNNYDYSQTGLYFVTIVTQNCEYLFGEIVNDEMVLNDAGMMVRSLDERSVIQLRRKPDRVPRSCRITLGLIRPTTVLCPLLPIPPVFYIFLRSFFCSRRSCLRSLRRIPAR